MGWKELITMIWNITAHQHFTALFKPAWNAVQLEEQIECSFSFYDLLQWNVFSVVWKFKSSATKSNETWEATTCTNFQPRITWYEAKMHRNFRQNAVNSQNTSGKENLPTLINLVGRLPWYEWDLVLIRSLKNQLGFHTSNKKIS